MLNIREILTKASDFFTDLGLDTPRLDAEVLLADVLDKKRVDLYVDFDQPLQQEEIDTYRQLILKRKEGIPVAYLTGQQEFMSLDFEITADVLIPRPETEHLVERTLEIIAEFYDQQDQVKVVDLGTGSGAIIISLAKLSEIELNALAIDISDAALKTAKKNAIRHKVKGYIDFKQGDLLEPVNEKVDIIVSNPPYISTDDMKTLPQDVKHEPVLALEAGSDGLKYYQAITRQARDYLNKDGFILFEVGEKQAEQVSQLLKQEGFRDLEVVEDYSGIERIVLARF